MNITPLTPLTSKIRQLEFIALDVEGDGSSGGFRLACAYDDEGAHVLRTIQSVKHFLFQRRHCQKIILSANLEYDYATLFQPFIGGWMVLMANGKWLKATYADGNKHAWVAWDIQRIAPLPVRVMGEIVGLPKLEAPEDWNAWRARQPNLSVVDYQLNQVKLAEYCSRDAEIVYRFAQLYQRTLNELGGQMKMTAASCAMDLFRRRFLKQEIAATWPEQNELARLCYFGGRCEAFRVGTVRDVNRYDVTSMYPSVMKDLEVGLPHTYHRLFPPFDVYRYLDRFGQVYGTINVPASFANPLPQRNSARLFFPYGKLRGSWTLSEVRNALERGCTIDSCEWVSWADETARPFGAYVATLYQQKELLALQDSPSEKIVKLLLNSLYGKFGQRADAGLEKLVVPLGDYDVEDYAEGTPYELAGYECFLMPVVSKFQSPHIHVLWAAEIAAQARIKLFNLIEPLAEEVVYCDTDSIHTVGCLPVGQGLGFLRSEERFRRSVYYAPKEYSGLNNDGAFVTHAKGIPDTLHSEFLRRGHVTFSQPIHTLEALRDGARIATWKNVHKTRRANPCNRKHSPVKDYNRPAITTYPARWPDEVLACED